MAEPVTRRQEKAIPKQDWQWYGLPGHFCASHRCLFHMTTLVGNYLVSTVGELRHDMDRPETRRKVAAGRFYETMVFPTEGVCECGCGQPQIKNYCELTCRGYNTTKEAREGHLAVCEEVATWCDPCEELLEDSAAYKH